MAKASEARYPSMRAFQSALLGCLGSNTAVDDADIFQQPTVAPGPRSNRTPTERVRKPPPFPSDVVITPSGLRRARDLPPPRERRSGDTPTERVKPTPFPSGWVPPLERSRGKRLLLTMAAMLLPVIGLWAWASFLIKDRQPAPVAREESPNPIVPLPDKPKVTRENYDKLKLGMTQEQLEGILGKGKLARADAEDISLSDAGAQTETYTRGPRPPESARSTFGRTRRLKGMAENSPIF